MQEFSNRFPFWVFERDPGEKYVIEPSRKLFGKQRYGLAKSEPRAGVVNRKDDYKSEEFATPWLNALNVYAEVWTIFESGNMKRVKKMDLLITGDNPSDLKGHGDRSILANVLHSKPIQVYNALKNTA